MPKALQQLDTDIWCLDQAFSLKGLEIGTRTTVVRLGDGSLWLHSPGPDTGAAYRALIREGEVRHLVAPNAFHYLYLEQASRLFPQALLWGPGAVARKRPRLTLQRLSDEPPPAWDTDLDLQALKGLVSQEYAFYHRPSRSLILTDLLFHLFPEGALSRLLLGLGGVSGQLTGSGLVSRIWLRDRRALHQSLKAVAAWDFQRILMSHGRIVEVDARQRFNQALDWILEPQTGHRG